MMRRLIVLRVVVLLVVTVLISRLYQLQLVDSDARRYGSSVEVITTRFVTVAPRRGEILASDGTTLLAESVPIYSIAVQPDSLPRRGTAQRAQVLGELAQLATLTSTLTISPALALEQRPELRRDLSGVTTLDTPLPQGTSALTLTIAPQHTLAALQLTQVYSDLLTLNNPIEPLINRSDLPRYQTLVIKEDVPHELALVVRENSLHLPGALIVEGYRRRYPHSNDVPSLSHLLGYIGRINECELAVENPASSWVNSLLDSVTYAPNCGLIPRQIAPNQRGIPPYQSDDRIGKDGLEYSYEAELRGTMGIQSLGVDALERLVIPARTLQPVRDGNNLVLSIDLEFQRQTEAIMRRWIAESEARRQALGGHRTQYNPITNGVAIAMDPRNGNILAMVSLPNYDNNIWVDPQRAAELQDILSPADPQRREELARLTPLFNRAIAGEYAPGSTLKQFVGAVALQMGVISPNTRLRDPGLLVLTERSGTIYRLPNSVRADNGEIDVMQALNLSSNVFFAFIAGGNDEVTNLGPRDMRISGLQIDRLAEGLEWFGLGRPTGIKLAGEGSGLVPTPTWKSHELREPWTTGNTYNTAIGQGYLQVTPLQLLNAAAAVANNGTLYHPQLVRQITDSSGKVVQQIYPEVLSQLPIEPAYLQVIREGMRRSVTEGRNVAARDDCSGLSIAGKTGTAEFGPVYVKDDGQQTRQSHSWFVGFAPYDNPQIAVVVLLEGTGDLNDGSSTLAVPAVTQIMQAYFKVTPPAELPRGCPVLPQ